MTLNAVLLAGFQDAHRRVPAIILDVVWKLIWLVLTGGVMIMVAIWFNTRLGLMELNGPASAFRSPVALLALGRQLWEIYAATLFWISAGLFLLSACTWILLEAYFRAAVLPPSRDGFFSNASRHFGTFLASSLVKIVFLGSTAAILGIVLFGRYLSVPPGEWADLWRGTRGGVVVAALVCLTVWFALTLLETLIRSDSLDMLGQDCFLVTGVLAILLAFEAMMVGAAIVGWIGLAALLSGSGGMLLAAAGLMASAVILAILHSYLLVVRFSALDIAARRLA